MVVMNGKRILLAIGVVILVILATILIFSVDWGGSDRSVKDGIKPVNIADFATTDTQVRISARGPVQNNQEHEAMTITVGRSEAVGVLFTGYEGQVSRTEQTASNEIAYKSFLSALHNSSFTAIQRPPRDIQYDGACPKGTRYTFEFIGGNNLPPSTWATTCGKKTGTFAGDLSTTLLLFQRQLPSAQYKALTTGTDF
jgi:hypothetical protein